MDYKKIAIGLIGGAVAGYVYVKFLKPKPRMVLKGAEASDEQDATPMGGGGGGGFAPSMDVDAVEEVVEETDMAQDMPEEVPVEKPIAVTKPMTITKPNDAPVSPVTSKPSSTVASKPIAPIYVKPSFGDKTGSKFSGIGGYSFDVDEPNLDL